MIKARELRMGNVVLYPRNEDPRNIILEKRVVFGILADDTVFFSQEEGEEATYPKDLNKAFPIPLTPEVLERCGFKNRSKGTDYYFELRGFILAGAGRKILPSVWGESGPEPYGIELISLHQLQNLYFALTGQELNYEL